MNQITREILTLHNGLMMLGYDDDIIVCALLIFKYRQYVATLLINTIKIFHYLFIYKNTILRVYKPVPDAYHQRFQGY